MHTDPAVPPGPPPQVLLRRAAGYLELGELLTEPDRDSPPSSLRLLARCLAELDGLPAEARIGGVASLIEGEALRVMGRWEAALAPLERVTERSAERVEAWVGLGWCLKRLGRLGEAITALERGLEASPAQPILLYNLACYHALAGEVPAATEYLARAISLDDRFRDLTGTERDFDPIRSDPRFMAVTHVTV